MLIIIIVYNKSFNYISYLLKRHWYNTISDYTWVTLGSFKRIVILCVHLNQIVQEILTGQWSSNYKLYRHVFNFNWFLKLGDHKLKRVDF